uniref:Uncharacterized protein n=1 Tax=Rhizophora mucronata TaxID=61149 RepID=A0A2P2J0K6_RHIMU
MSTVVALKPETCKFSI